MQAKIYHDKYRDEEFTQLLIRRLRQRIRQDGDPDSSTRTRNANGV